jgi:hypothetical protein
MSESKIKPELLPADLGGGDIQYIKRPDYARRTAETVALKLKAEIKKDHVMQILTALDGGQQELPGDNPEPIVKLFETVKEDYQAGVQEVKRKEKEAADKKAQDEQAAKEAKDKEDKLFALVKQEQPNLEIFGKFDTGNMDRFIARDGVTTEELLGAYKAGLKLGDFNGWMLGDLVLQLEQRGQTNVMKRIAEDNGTAYSKIYNDAKTARCFPPDKRNPNVSFTIYREYANAHFTDEQKKTAVLLVDEISKGKHTAQSIRVSVRKAQGKTEEKVAPENDDKKLFLVIDAGHVYEDQVQWVKGFPKKLVGGGVHIIDPVTRLQFTNFRAKPENRWAELGEWKEEAEPEPEETKKGKGKK